MQKLSSPHWTIPVALLLICAVSFGALINNLGFYWDDWSIMWYAHFLSPADLHQAYAVDRPLLSGIIAVTTKLLGESPLGWQIFAILTRWLSCLALWWALTILWPQRVGLVASITMLFAIYPGFKQQHIAITYGIGFILIGVFLLSLATMLLAMQKKRWFWPLYLLSIAFSGYAMFVSEYFFGLEFLRPILIWLILGQTLPNTRQRLQRVILYQLPYLALSALFIIWRLTNITPRAEITIFEQFNTNPWAGIGELLSKIFQGIYLSLVLAWKQTVNFFSLLEMNKLTLTHYLAVTGLTAAFIMIYLALLRNHFVNLEKNPPAPERRWGVESILLGLFALLVGGIPIWVTNLQMSLSFSEDRFTLPMMLGASLVLAGLIWAIPRAYLQKAILVGVAVGLAAGMHFQTTLSFQKEWVEQKNFFWQLSWRVPGIKPNTTLMVLDTPFIYNWDNSLSALLNWIYAPDWDGRDLPYLFYNVDVHQKKDRDVFEKDLPISVDIRNTHFEGSTSQSIVVIYRPPACLRIINPKTDQRYPDQTRDYLRILAISRPSLVITETDTAAEPPTHIFGPEPAKDWCYYYGKAELARQRQDWAEVVNLGNQALNLERKFDRRNAVELMPYIEGYAQTDQWERALQLSLKTYQSWDKMRPMLCDLWKKILQEKPINSIDQSILESLQESLQCYIQ
ncbi:MAG: hypothetical protein JXB15_13110 [Anaerolineales bacterium]|nr:hypothetical protein [Anaerolineales bacterium]